MDYSRSEKKFIFKMPLIAIGGIFGGLFLLYLAYQSFLLVNTGNSTPQTISAQELIDNGYSDNAYITLTDYKANTDMILTEVEPQAGQSLRESWVPITPKGAKHNDTLNILMMTRAFEHDVHIRKFKKNPTFTGLVINQARALDTELQDAILYYYPQSDINDIYIIEHNRTPPGYFKVAIYLLGGLLCILTGIGIGYTFIKTILHL
ncbi:hypothetical protein JD969_12235 [Planctomycetota bacterium]|nr:hypothetical protein JD969_12235 [Planctomycetota bacterium]